MSRIDWNEVGLGTESDAAIGERLGVSVKTVQAARRRRKIRPYGYRPRPTEDMTMAELDSWLRRRRRPG